MQERADAAQKFHSKEAEEAAKKVAAKAYTPVVMDAQGTTKDQGPKVVAPTPAQITAIKVLDSLFLFWTQPVHVIIAS